MRFRRGDIILNKWAGDNNPIKVFVYLGASGKYGKAWAVVDGTLREHTTCEPRAMNADTEHYILLGHTEAFSVARDDILREREKVDAEINRRKA